MIREAVETLAPPGSLPSLEATGATPIEEADAIVAAIHKMANGRNIRPANLYRRVATVELIGSAASIEAE